MTATAPQGNARHTTERVLAFHNSKMRMKMLSYGETVCSDKSDDEET